MNNELEIEELKKEIKKIKETLKLQMQLCIWIAASTGITLSAALSAVAFVFMDRFY